MTNFKQIFDFLSKLQVHNDRNWFNEHKDEYIAAHREFAGFVNALIVPLSQLDESIGTVSAEECIFRIYRDVRVCQIYEGSSDIQKILIGRGLLD